MISSSCCPLMLLYCRMDTAFAMLFSMASRPYLSTLFLFFSQWVMQPTPETCRRVGVSAPAGGNLLPTLKRQKQQFHMHRWCDLFCGFTYMSYMITCENTLDKTTRSKIARKSPHRGFAPFNRPDGARRFSIYSLPTANYCDECISYFDSLTHRRFMPMGFSYALNSG